MTLPCVLTPGVGSLFRRPAARAPREPLCSTGLFQRELLVVFLGAAKSLAGAREILLDLLPVNATGNSVRPVLALFVLVYSHFNLSLLRLDPAIVRLVKPKLRYWLRSTNRSKSGERAHTPTIASSLAVSTGVRHAPQPAIGRGYRACGRLLRHIRRARPQNPFSVPGHARQAANCVKCASGTPDPQGSGMHPPRNRYFTLQFVAV